jgi:cell division control protein 6
MAYNDGVLGEMVIPLCAAFAAQEHGDARRALDLLRVSGEIAERENQPQVLEEHVRRAQEKIEIDRVVEVVRTLPTQSNLVLYSIILMRNRGSEGKNVTTGEMYNVYQLCHHIDVDILAAQGYDLMSNLICWE